MLRLRLRTQSRVERLVCVSVLRHTVSVDQTYMVVGDCLLVNPL